MKRIALLMAIAVAGCNTSQTPPSKMDATTLDLLAEGSSDACNREDVRTTLLTEIKPTIRPSGNEISQDVEGGISLITYTFDTIALAGVDKAIKSVSCDANLTVKYKDHEDRTFQVRYTIRPSVEDKQAFVINTVAPEAIEYTKAAAQNAVATVVADRVHRLQREETPQQLSAEENTASADAVEKSGDINNSDTDTTPTPPNTTPTAPNESPTPSHEL